MLLHFGWGNLQTMKLDISSRPIPAKFSSISLGDVFRPTDRYCYYLKIQSNKDSEINAVDLETNFQWHFDNDTLVYKAQSANLSVIF